MVRRASKLIVGGGRLRAERVFTPEGCLDKYFFLGALPEDTMP